MSSSLLTGLSAAVTATIEVIEGQSGTTRVVPQGAFKWADLLDAPPEEVQKVARQTEQGRTWFDLDVIDVRDSAATPFTGIGSRRIVEVDFEILFVRYVQHRTTIERGVRLDSRVEMRCALDDVVQALGRPHNLDTTIDDRETGIVDGCMRAPLPALRRIERDWVNHLLRTTVIATAIIDVTQEV